MSAAHPQPHHSLQQSKEDLALFAQLQQAERFLQDGRISEARKCYEIILQAYPHQAEALHFLSLIYFQEGNAQAALQAIDAALASSPNYALAHNNKGSMLIELKQPLAALACYEQAIVCDAKFALAHFNRGVTLYDLRKLEEAIQSYDQAIALDPQYAQAYNNRANTLKELLQVKQAIIGYDQALHIKPDFAEAHWNRALAHLVLGNYEQGWQDYESRWQSSDLSHAAGKRDLQGKLWLGLEPLEHKTILLHSEQGLGDAIQFCRYSKLVANLGARVILEVEKPLAHLFQTLAGVSQILEKGQPLPPFDFHCPLISLPFAFKTTLDNIPFTNKYLSIDSTKASFWKAKLGPQTKFRVGLVWSGGFRPNQPEAWAVNARRNVPLALLAPLKHAAIEFYSLQKGQPGESELVALRAAGWSGPNLIDLTAQLHSFADTAALMDQLDLIITVDTAIAHLAGALGKTVWILNRFDTCWRWLLDRNDSPWYDSVQIFRQAQLGQWEPVIERVRNQLQQLMATKSK
ncbi:GT9_LPS_heptosyltransferase domain containing protein [Burkholderiaceae bacterium]|jgi:tetratricopeptide (TPR) repeat protein